MPFCNVETPSKIKSFMFQILFYFVRFYDDIY